MSLLFFLKMLADICFYLSIAGFFAVPFGLEDPLVLHAVLIALACALGRAWERPGSGDGKKGVQRFVPLALLAVVFTALQCIDLPGQAGIAGFVILLPCFVYGFYCLAKRAWDPELSESREQFLLLVKILPFMLVVGLFAIDVGRLQTHTLPHAVLFLVSSILLLRMLRQKPSVLSDRRFLLANGLAASGALLAALFFSSKAFLGTVSAALSALWSVLVTPLLVIIMAVAMVVYWLFSLLFSGTAVKQTGQEIHIDLEGAEELMEEAGLPGSSGHPVLAAFFVLLLAALVIFIIFLLFRRLRPAIGGRKGNASLEKRSFLPSQESGRNKRTVFSLAGTPQDRVRRRYAKVLKLCAKRGAEGLAGVSTMQQLQIECSVLPEGAKELEALRELYLAARYGEETDAAAAKEADRLFHALQDMFRRR